MVIGLTVGPGRCQNSSCLYFGKDTHFANVKPNSSIIRPFSTTYGVKESTCVNKCFNSPSCSSIFFEKNSGICNLYDTVFAVKERLVPSPNTSHFRIVSGECLPVVYSYLTPVPHNHRIRTTRQPCRYSEEEEKKTRIHSMEKKGSMKRHEPGRQKSWPETEYAGP